ncbi:transposase [Deinococcus sp. SDU3-2]|uniref:Transposase n=1 Tax=Deinococcus terrestris TaxID=2651870 RepID=A0A7X1TR48_9DEIO|nr:transposase [Deinococcus terrestris]
MLPALQEGGRPRTAKMDGVICATVDVLQNGCTWHNLPHDSPAWESVSGYFRRFERDGTWGAVHRFLIRRTRRQVGRDPEPSAGIHQRSDPSLCASHGDSWSGEQVSWAKALLAWPSAS